MDGVAKIRRISGTEKQKDLMFLGAFFGALVVSRLLPMLATGNFSYMLSLKVLVGCLLFAAAFTGALAITKPGLGSWSLAALASGIYAALFAIFRVALLGWRIEGALWGTISHFVWMTVAVGVLLFVLSQDFAPLWVLLVVGFVAGMFAASIAYYLTFVIVEERAIRSLGIIGFLKHSLWRVALGGVGLAGVMFAAHKAKGSPLAKF